MTPDELRAIMTWLMDKVELVPDEKQISIRFITPSENEMIKAGLNEEGVNRLLKEPWWDEMVEDIVDTPEMCDPDDSPEQVLEYARDVISEYIRKRFPLEG